jgi:hypothetical protein
MLLSMPPNTVRAAAYSIVSLRNNGLNKPSPLDGPDKTPLVEHQMEFGAYPNPFNPTTTITFVLPEIARATVRVYDIAGREVSMLLNGVMDAGYHTATWNATNFASGVYFARLEVADLNGRQVYSKTNKVLLTK